jgi:NAD(P)-dependent dehydrogenase (short-subunit alcohol dehydrogenase family)
MQHRRAGAELVTPEGLVGRGIQQLVSLDGRHAVITGGARGIGYAIARRLAEAGAEVLIGDKDVKGATASAEAIAKEFGVRAFPCALDVADARSMARLAEVAVEKLGTIEIWVNNAGVYPAKNLIDTTDEEWDFVNDVNLKGTFLGCREAGRRMVTAGCGVIINITSVSGYRGRPSMAHYIASKHGVVGLTKALALELGPKGIRVLAVAPALTETPGYQEAMDRNSDGAASGQSNKELHERIRSMVPLGRMGQPDDVARVVLFCASDLAAFVTATTVFADGGVSAF